MLYCGLFSLAVFASTSLAGPVYRAGKFIYPRDGIITSEDEVDRLHLYSEYASATYCNVDVAPGTPVACEVNCDRVLADGGIIVRAVHHEETDIAGYVAVVDSRKQIIFAARGTASDENWHTNLDIWKVPSSLAPGAWVHHWFYQAWVDISDGIRDAIKEAVSAHPDYKIVLVGHSLGGAIASIAAGHLRADDGYQLDLYTYGQPRIGNDILSDFITNQPGLLYRVTHEADPVPRLPPVALDNNDLGWRHTSPEFWLTGNPTDPRHWPVEFIKTCEGNNNLSCNANGNIAFNAEDHGVYFGIMGCLISVEVNTLDGVSSPKDIEIQVVTLGETLWQLRVEAKERMKKVKEGV